MDSKNYKKSNICLHNIKSDYFIQKIFNYFGKIKSFKIIKPNKQLQHRLNLSIKDYKEYSGTFTPIEIEIIPTKVNSNGYAKFINKISNNFDYYHIYFNNENKEIKRDTIYKHDKVTKIKVILDYQIKSFEGLFKYCDIESLYFKKFYRNNIDNMKEMFSECKGLKELNLSNFNTSNVSNMNRMFYNCSSLTELNLNNFNTNNVTNMCSMFQYCKSLKELNISNFNTINVTNMRGMFFNCLSLKNLNISNFNTLNVKDMNSMFANCKSLEKLNLSNFNTINLTDTGGMFFGCSSLKKLDLSNFNTKNVINMCNMFYECSSLKDLNLSNFYINAQTNIIDMFYGCSDELKTKIKGQNKNICLED